MPYQRSTRYPELFKPGDGAVWWAFLPVAKGRRERVSTKHTDELAAHRWYLERIRRAPSEAVGAAPKKDRTLEHALAARLEWLTSARESDDPTRRKLSAETINFYEKKSKPLVNVLGADTLLSSIGHEEIRRYISVRAKTTKATTIAKELTALSMAMKLARKDGVDCARFDDIKPEDFAAVYVPKTRWLTESEVDAMLEVLNTKRRGLFAFLVMTGATFPSEVAPFRRSMLEVKTFTVRIPGTKRDTRDRTIVIPSYGRRFLDVALEGLEKEPESTFEAWTNIRGDLHDAARLLSLCAPCRAARLAWARHAKGTKRPVPGGSCKACARAKPFAPCSPNDLRRTFAQWLVRSGVPYELAAPMMGHKDTKMLQLVYGRRDATSVAGLVEIALRSAPKGARERKAG